jgi:P4 family phage/plasmid primase-like protien
MTTESMFSDGYGEYLHQIRLLDNNHFELIPASGRKLIVSIPTGTNQQYTITRMMEECTAAGYDYISQDNVSTLYLEALQNDRFRIAAFEDINSISEGKDAKSHLLIAHRPEIGSDEIRKDRLISSAVQQILSNHKFVTVEESGVILVYDCGVYGNGGEITIEREAEKLLGFALSNKDLAEIKGHIRRLTYRKLTAFDIDLNIINLRNGLYWIRENELRPHTPEYFSFNQKPILFDPNKRPVAFWEYLREVLYPDDIRTAIHLMAYTFHRDNPYELVAFLLGTGGNGKSVFTGVLTALHGTANISNVSLHDLVNNKFAKADLEGKDVNIDTELSSSTIRDTAILKKITGNQPMRIERKNKTAYDAKIHAKMIINANHLHENPDYSDADFRRQIVISFPKQFDDKKANPHLLRELTTDSELSGLFNVLMNALREVLKHGVYVKKRTINERREKYELASDPITAFVQDAIQDPLSDSGGDRKEDVYAGYVRFCKFHKLPIESLEVFGKRATRQFKFQSGREGSGQRKNIWKGVRLMKWTNEKQIAEVPNI